MSSHQIRTFISSATARLAATYLGIIMLMSLGFSIALYNTSSQQLGRQIPPDSLFRTSAQAGQRSIEGPGNPATIPSPAVTRYFEKRADEGREAIVVRLLYLNIVTLVLGSLLSYVLARRSLEPIEESMEAQAQFVSDASHELRTPLTAIQTANEVFLRRSKPTIADAKKLIEQNTEDVKRLKHLSDGLLNLAQQKQQPLSLQPVHVQDAVSAALTQVVPQATAKSITVEDETGQLRVQADSSMLTQALVIVLDNAIKYSPEKSTVTLSTSTKAKTVSIHVADEGIGIRASDIPHVFRRFYRADGSRTDSGTNGYGLGLAIAQQIMENQHGSIEVASKPNKGSIFSLKLPSTSGN